MLRAPKRSFVGFGTKKNDRDIKLFTDNLGGINTVYRTFHYDIHQNNIRRGIFNSSYSLLSRCNFSNNRKSGRRKNRTNI